MNDAELLEYLKVQLEAWTKYSEARAFNTCPTGYSNIKPNYAEWPEVSKADFKKAYEAFAAIVKEKFGCYGPRYAKSLSGADQNVNIWSFLAEPFDSTNKRKFNFHVRVKAGENP